MDVPSERGISDIPTSRGQLPNRTHSYTNFDTLTYQSLASMTAIPSYFLTHSKENNVINLFQILL